MPVSSFGGAQGAIGEATGQRGGGRGDGDRNRGERSFREPKAQRDRPARGEQKKVQQPKKTTLGTPTVSDSLVKSGPTTRPVTAKDKLTQKLRRGRRASILADVDAGTLGSANVSRPGAREPKVLFG